MSRMIAALAVLVAGAEAGRNWAKAGCSLVPNDEFSPTGSNRVMDCRGETTGGKLRIIPQDAPGTADVIGSDSLGHLWLSNNMLTSIDAPQMKGFTNLKQLFADHNSIRLVESNAFAEVANLEFLLLNNNKMKFFPAGLGVLGSLLYLDVANNLIKDLQPVYVNGMDSLRYLNVANNRINTVKCGTFNSVQGSLNYLNTSGNKASCGIQKYSSINPMAVGTDATIQCVCPTWYGDEASARSGAVGFCEEASDQVCGSGPALLKLTAKAMNVDQGWEKITDKLAEWVAPDNHMSGQISNFFEQLEGTKVETVEDSGLSGTAGALVAVCIISIGALIAVIAVKKDHFKNGTNVGPFSDVTSSYAASDITGYRKHMRGAGNSKSTVVSHSINGSEAIVNAMDDPTQAEFQASMDYLQGTLQAPTGKIRTGKLTEYCHSLGASSEASSEASVATNSAVGIDERPSFDSHAAPDLPAHDDDVELMSEDTPDTGDTADKLQARASFYNMFNEAAWNGEVPHGYD